MGRYYSHLYLRNRQGPFKWYRYNKKPAHSYYPHHAQHNHCVRMLRRCQLSPLKSTEARQYYEEKLSPGWTPESVSVNLDFNHSLKNISYKAIQQYSYRDVADFIKHLPQHHSRLSKKHPTRKKATVIAYKNSITDRHTRKLNLIETEHWACGFIEKKRRKRLSLFFHETYINSITIDKSTDHAHCN